MQDGGSGFANIVVTADRADTLYGTLLSAGRIDGFGLILVTCGGNDFLFFQDFAAHRAMGAFGQTGFDAGGFKRFAERSGMIERGDGSENLRIRLSPFCPKNSGIGDFAFFGAGRLERHGPGSVDNFFLDLVTVCALTIKANQIQSSPEDYLDEAGLRQSDR